MTRVIVLQGGWSAEREVSLSTATGISDALQRLGYEVIPVDPSPNLLTLTKQLYDAQGDVAFIALHGTGGEDGTIQAILNLAQIPYTHSGMTASATGMDKIKTKAIVQAFGIPVTPHKTLLRQELVKGHPFPIPYVVKPIADGSTIGVNIIKCDDDLQEACMNGDDNQFVMVEKYIDGEELTVGVSDLFTDDGKPEALCVTAMKSKNDFYDYTAKYTDGMTIHVVNPDLPPKVLNQLKEYAVKAHQALGCEMISRSDFRYNPDDGIIFLETNTHPGMTPLSLYPEQIQAAGHSFDKLIKAMIESALKIKKKNGDNNSVKQQAA